MSSGEASTFNALRWPEGWGAHQVASSAAGVERRPPLGARSALAASRDLSICKGSAWTAVEMWLNVCLTARNRGFTGRWL